MKSPKAIINNTVGYLTIANAARKGKTIRTFDVDGERIYQIQINS